MKRQSGFTLAEVLITLGIIGVVAAMTIPTLMTNTNKSEFKTGYKKVLSAVNQAVTMSIALDYLDFADTTSGTSDGSLYKLLTDRMHVVQTATAAADGSDVAKMFGSTAASNYTLFFSDGMVLSFPQTARTCTLVGGSTSTGGLKCAAIVDVNGSRNPNKLTHCMLAGDTQAALAVDNTASNGICTEDHIFIGDQYSVLLKGQQVLPNGYGAKYVLYNN